jgi:hypothetical protein
VLNDKYGISGAQPLEQFLEALEKVWDLEKPLTILNETNGEEAAGFCEGDSCGVPSKE